VFRPVFDIRKPASRLFFLALVVILTAPALLPVLIPHAKAYTQITNRSVTIGSGQANTATSYSFSFTTATGAAHLDGIKLIMCTVAIGSYPGGTCTKPGTSSSLFSTGTYGSISGFTDTTAFTIDTSGANDCVATGHPEVLCLKRTSASNDTAGAKTLVINGVTNPNVTGSFYVGITTYSSNTWASANRMDAGTVAAAVVSTLQVNARVAEVLNFCVGSTTVDSDSTGIVATDCSTVTGSSVNLGTLDSSKINVTPVTTDCTTSDCGTNGVAMVRSNAINGTSVYYDAVQNGTNHKGTLRVSGSTCDATADNSSSDTTDNTDQCFNVRTAAAAFDTTTERFGMTIAGVNCGSTTSYNTCTGNGTSNLVRSANYNGDGTNTYNSGATDSDEVNGPTSNKYAWNESGAAVQIASSTSSTVKQIDDEALILKFAAHPLITTPFGVYQAQADFIAVSTY
jgi:hypothetical protein